MNPGLAAVLAASGPLLIDFDGPICSIFSGYAATTIASELRAVLIRLGVDLPASIAQEPDPIAILSWTDTVARPELTRAVEDALRVAEVQAAGSAVPTPGGYAVLSAARETGRPVAIVSNNSAPAIEAYIQAHRLNSYVAQVFGREPYAPWRMKPNSEPILRAAAALKAEPQHCVLIGDSLTDIKGAQAAGVPVIGYANAPAKVESFPCAGADVIVTDMTEIASEIRARRWNI